MNDNNGKIVAFNYDVLAKDAQKMTRVHAHKNKEQLQRTAAAVVDIGRRLADVRHKIGGPHFQAWLKVEFRWSLTTASNYMRIAEQFAELDCLHQFQPTVLRLLARNKVSAPARSEAIEAARAGELITEGRANEIIRKHHPQEAQPIKPQALYRLRAALRSLADDPQPFAASLEADELEALADELLNLAMQLRNSRRPPPAKPNGRRRKKGAGTNGAKPRQTAAAGS